MGNLSDTYSPSDYILLDFDTMYNRGSTQPFRENMFLQLYGWRHEVNVDSEEIRGESGLITCMKCEDCTQTDLRKATANRFRFRPVRTGTRDQKKPLVVAAGQQCKRKECNTITSIRSLLLCMKTFSASFTNFTGLLSQSHDWRCYVNRRVLAIPPIWLQKHTDLRELSWFVASAYPR